MTETLEMPGTTRPPDGLGRVGVRATTSPWAVDPCGEGATGTVVPTNRNASHAARPGTGAGGSPASGRQGTGGSTSLGRQPKVSDFESDTFRRVATFRPAATVGSTRGVRRSERTMSVRLRS
jgi:hypothetical protein